MPPRFRRGLPEMRRFLCKEIKDARPVCPQLVTIVFVTRSSFSKSSVKLARGQARPCGPYRFARGVLPDAGRNLRRFDLKFRKTRFFEKFPAFSPKPWSFVEICDKLVPLSAPDMRSFMRLYPIPFSANRFDQHGSDGLVCGWSAGHVKADYKFNCQRGMAMAACQKATPIASLCRRDEIIDGNFGSSSSRRTRERNLVFGPLDRDRRRRACG